MWWRPRSVSTVAACCQRAWWSICYLVRVDCVTATCVRAGADLYAYIPPASIARPRIADSGTFWTCQKSSRLSRFWMNKGALIIMDYVPNGTRPTCRMRYGYMIKHVDTGHCIAVVACKAIP